jgi:hypothetical protein
MIKIGRGRDKKPRKRKMLSNAGSVALNAGNTGLAAAGTLGVAGLIASPQNAALQGRLARAGLVGGAGYGLYQGIKKLKSKKNTNYSQSINKMGNIARFETPVLNSVEPAEYHKHLFDTAVAQIGEAFEAGELTEQEAIALEINAIRELRDRLSDENIDFICEEMGYDPEEIAEYLDSQGDEEEEYDEEEYEDGDYSSGANLAEFQSGNAFGYNLQTLLLEDGYDDIEEGAIALSSALGVSGEEAAGLLTGDYVPTEETIALLEEIFELDEDQAEALASSAYEAWEESGLVEEGDEEDDDEDSEANYRLYQAESKIAEFQTREELRTSLAELELVAQQGLQEWWLPPAAYRAIMGNDSTDQQRIASFSAACQEDGVELGDRLYAMQFAIACFREAGPLYGNQIIEEELSMTPEEAKFEASVETQAQRNHRRRMQNNPLPQ